MIVCRTMFSLFVSLALVACGNHTEKQSVATDTTAKSPVIHEEAVSFQDGNKTLNSFIYFDSAATGKQATIVVVPEWWGLNDYAKMRAKQLAALGYTAMALDIYGNGEQAANPEQANKLATPFYLNPALGAMRMKAALKFLAGYPRADTGKIAAMGYCFGGSVVLEAARQGVPLKSVASFHGNYPTGAWNTGWHGEVLICHGAADSISTMSQYDAFRKQLDSIGIVHTDKVYANATHAFTNPASTEVAMKFNLPIRYNGAADTASWNDMKSFWSKTLR
jgi:dienelactone hydrolase